MNNKINLEKLPRSRPEAKSAGSKHYFTGKPCKNGHTDARLTSNRCCMGCSRDSSRKYGQENKEIVSERLRKWRENNKDFIKNYNSEWKTDNKDRISKYNREYYLLNKGKIHSNNSKRKLLKRQAVPEWADKEEIAYIYELASEKGLEVDHIVPLTSKYVCGLHTGDNLRCIPSKLNIQKGNRYWPDMPEEFIEIGG